MYLSPTKNIGEKTPVSYIFELNGGILKNDSMTDIDWKEVPWSSDKIPDKLEKLKKAGARIIIVTNKSDFTLSMMSRIMFRHNMKKIEDILGFSFEMLVSTANDIFCMPAPGMILFLRKHCNFGAESCLMVGDNMLTKKFAFNSGIKFCKTENFVTTGYINENDNLPPLIAAQLPDNTHSNDKVTCLIENILRFRQNRTVLILIGFPRSGKTTFAEDMQDKFPQLKIIAGKNAVNSQMDLALCYTLMQSKHQLIIDARNPDIESRKSIIKIAQEFRYNSIVGIYFDVQKELAMVNKPIK